MGTRNLTCIVSKGEYKVAKYCQWDGYPEGQGCDLLKILKGTNLKRLEENLSKVIPFNKERYQNDLMNLGLTKEDLEANFLSFDKLNIERKYLEVRRELSRNTGAEIVRIIAETEDKIEIHNDLDFAADSLFCEWCYVIDLDRNTFEVFRGFNEKPLNKKERFYFLQKENMKYYPVKFLCEFDLNNLPTRDDFLMKANV